MAVRKRASALFGVLGATCVMLWLARASEPHFALFDDIEMARSIAGFWGGVPASWNWCVHPALTAPLNLLTRLWPDVSWYGISQLALLWVALAVTLGSGPIAARRAGLPAWIGGAAAAIWCAAYTVEASTTITFTTTAAALGASGAWALAAAELAPGREGRSVALAFLPMGLSLITRYLAFLPALAFWLLLLIARAGLRNRRVLRAALGCCAAAALLYGWQYAAPYWQGETEYVRWAQARAALYDFSNLSLLTEADLAAVGCTADDLALFSRFCSLNGALSTEAMRALAARCAEIERALPLSERVLAALQSLWERVWLTPTLKARALCLAGLGGLGTLTAISAGKPKRALWPICALLGAGAAMLGLALAGRIPARVIQAVLLPGSATALALALYAPRPEGLKRRIPAALLAACCLIAAGHGAWKAYQLYHNPQASWPARIEADETAYVNANPELFFIEDNTLQPPRGVLAGGEATRNLIRWGDWDGRSPGYRRAAERFGLDLFHLKADDLLRGDVRFLTREDAPDEALIRWLRTASSSAHAERVDQIGEINVFRFAR